MRSFYAAFLAASILLSSGELLAQSRSAVMTVSVMVVRSGPASSTAAAANAATLAGNGITGTTTIIPSSAEQPLPAAPRATEAEVVIPTAAQSDLASSVMMTTINY